MPKPCWLNVSVPVNSKHHAWSLDTPLTATCHCDHGPTNRLRARSSSRPCGMSEMWAENKWLVCDRARCWRRICHRFFTCWGPDCLLAHCPSCFSNPATAGVRMDAIVANFESLSSHAFAIVWIAPAFGRLMSCHEIAGGCLITKQLSAYTVFTVWLSDCLIVWL